MGRLKLSASDLNDKQIAELSPAEIKELIFDLQQHKVELQMQNEELRHIQQELEEARDDYLDLYEFSPVPYFTLDDSGVITKVNLAASNLIGLSKRNLASTPLSQYIAAADQEAFDVHLSQVSDDNSGAMCEVSLRHKDGKGKRLEFHTTRIGGAQGLIKIAAVDVTAREEAEAMMKRNNSVLEQRVNERTVELNETNEYLRDEIRLHKKARKELSRVVHELERSNSELTQFAYVASHDLQEPLRNIVTSLQLLARKLTEDISPEAEKFLNYAVESAQRMSNLIHALLEYSRVGRSEQQFQEVNCTEVVASALHMLRSAIEENKAEVTYGALPRIVANPTQLTQLFQNLVSNSIKFRSSQPPMINISANETADEWVFTISDNGIGINPEYLERIFLIFQRLHTSTEFPGAGIGLAIARKIVSNHLGRIWVESKPEHGSVFYFTIKKSLKATAHKIAFEK
jgi:two-component system, chemotaxis family, sensor kinase Cph1